MEPTPQSSTPTTWPDVPDDVLEFAKKQTLLALSEDSPYSVASRLIDYYDVTGNYVGASFAELEPNDPGQVTATDLHAASLMNVEFGPRSSRRLLFGPTAENISTTFRAVPDVELAATDAETLERMYEFYMAVKDAISNPNVKASNPWVTSSKLCARKRPRLFPVRDRVVCSFLGILKLDDARRDWLVFRALMQDLEVRNALDLLPGLVQTAASDRNVVLDNSPLRLLDAALWTYAKASGD